jgi:N-acetyl-alpha-D-muramate 1-phosphate uridylyltransferase
MIPPPCSGMVLAAGLGTRLRPLTETIPKPLVEINGQSLLDHILDRLALAGVERVVVNVHYKARMIAEQLARRDRPRIELSEETELFGTGGGVAHALDRLDDTFFVINSDIFWRDGKEPVLQRLTAAFDPDRTDAVLLLQQTATAIGYEGSGDYFLDGAGNPQRRGERPTAPYLFAGIQLLHRRLFDGVRECAFSLVRLYDRAEAAGRLGAVIHDGEWFHVGTLEGLAATRAGVVASRRALGRRARLHE